MVLKRDLGEDCRRHGEHPRILCRKSCVDHSVIVSQSDETNSQSLNINPGAAFITFRLPDRCLIGLDCSVLFRLPHAAGENSGSRA